MSFVSTAHIITCCPLLFHAGHTHSCTWICLPKYTLRLSLIVAVTPCGISTFGTESLSNLCFFLPPTRGCPGLLPLTMSCDASRWASIHLIVALPEAAKAVHHAFLEIKTLKACTCSSCRLNCSLGCRTLVLSVGIALLHSRHRHCGYWVNPARSWTM